MALSGNLIDGRFTDQLVPDHGGLPPLPPLEDDKGGEGLPEAPHPFKLRLSAVCCAGLAGSSLALTMLAGVGTVFMPAQAAGAEVKLASSYRPLIEINCDRLGESADRPGYRNIICPYKGAPKF